MLGETRRRWASVTRLAGFPVKLLAEKVEDKAMYELCWTLGFSLFQGHYFSRPETVSRKDLPGELAVIARLMNVTMDADSRDRDLEREFRADPGLSLKLLKIVNSAASGGNGIESIHHAIRLIGRLPLYRCLALLFASSAPRGDDVTQGWCCWRWARAILRVARRAYREACGLGVALSDRSAVGVRRGAWYTHAGVDGPVRMSPDVERLFWIVADHSLRISNSR